MEYNVKVFVPVKITDDTISYKIIRAEFSILCLAVVFFNQMEKIYDMKYYKVELCKSTTIKEDKNGNC